MRANYQRSMILNEFPIKIAQFSDYFLQIAASRHYLSAKSVKPLLLTLTYQFPFFVVHSVILLVHPHKKLINLG